MANTYDLAGRNAIVTGAAKGIGRAIATLLRASGARVCGWDQNAVDLAGCDSERVDITRPEEIDAALARTLERFGRIDLLVNDAGYVGRTQEFANHGRSDWQRIVAVNLVGTMQVTQAVLPHLIAGGGGRIVNFASLAGKEGLPGITGYSAASGGVLSFSKALSREVVAHKVLVNVVAPGPIDTDMIRDLGEDVVTRMIADSPMKRLGRPQEVAELVA
jgi:3-oxoacyl-[acyl-carrier protein] reductase